MSNLVTALNGASDANGIATITEVPLQGMITLRGDLSKAAIKKAATTAAGVDMPGQGQANMNGDSGITWMSTDELLILCPYGDVAANLATMTKALAKTHALAVDVSDARASFTVSGPNARDAMAKLVPVDLAKGSFEPGMFRRTRMAQVAAAFWMTDAETFQIVCFRSVADYVFEVLKIAAQPGSEVGFL
ncbi:sarcosine oxidase subunit gamma family protein [Pseudosulfitobacter sp. SM2401]|uniref:sarcosine oxidase subunit gamma n=1 Tax=Pseudosulfitobacter sp. SM2401 TaxID=3350098 RepID=UPI0036F24E90